MRDYKQARFEAPTPDDVHGMNGYKNYGCRCETCRLANKEYNLAKRYGLTPEEYVALGDSSDWCCQMCGTQKERLGLDVDHCHETGKVRGLLCRGCNTAIGKLGDSYESIKDRIDRYFDPQPLRS